MKSSYKNIALVLTSTLGIVLGFQNCGIGIGQYRSVNSDKNKPANNGEGYTGKTFVNLDKNGTCVGGTAVKDAVDLIDGRYFQTVKNCVAQTAVDITSSIEAMAHNLGAVLFGPILLERLEARQTSYSEVLCRGVADELTSGQKPFADVSMQPTGEMETQTNGTIIGPRYRGYVKLGAYDISGALIFTEEFEIKKAVEMPPISGTRTFRIDSATSGPQGTNSSTQPAPQVPPAPGQQTSPPPFLEHYGLMIPPSGPAMFFFKTPSMTTPLVVRSMDCFKHGN